MKRSAAALLFLLAPALVHSALAGDGFGAATGGAGGPVVTVHTSTDFRLLATNPAPYVIQISGLITGSFKVGANKTIIGTGTHPTVIGELAIDGQTNVIIHNLFIQNDIGAGDGDGVRIIGGSQNIWVDHCTFTDCSDGSVDTTQGSDLVTVSWCKFNYTRDNLHNFVNLIGNSDTDFGNYRLTFHHNWWSTLCKQRMPSQRFGQSHVYNNYFNCVSNQHCTAVRLQAEMLSENNFYQSVVNPVFRFAGDTGQSISTAGNIYAGCTGTIDPGFDFAFFPPYPYTLDATANVPFIVTNGAGARSTPWFKVAGGGGRSTGGPFAFYGTIGQAEAGVLGGGFQLRGGFWILPMVIQTPGSPTLTIVRAGSGQATISWTPPAPGFMLQETLSLAPPGWTPSPSGPTNPIVVPATLPVKFYRLSKP